MRLPGVHVYINHPSKPSKIAPCQSARSTPDYGSVIYTIQDMHHASPAKDVSSAPGIRDRVASFIGRIHKLKKSIDRITLVCRRGHFLCFVVLAILLRHVNGPLAAAP